MDRRTFLCNLALGAAGLAVSRRVAAEADLAPFRAEIEKHHDEAVKRLQRWWAGRSSAAVSSLLRRDVFQSRPGRAQDRLRLQHALTPQAPPRPGPGCIGRFVGPSADPSSWQAGRPAENERRGPEWVCRSRGAGLAR